MDPIEIVGFVAMAVGAAAFLPQVWQSWRTRSTRDINLRTVSILSVSIALFAVYGISLKSPSLIAANAVAGAMVASLVFLKVRHG